MSECQFELLLQGTEQQLVNLMTTQPAALNQSLFKSSSYFQSTVSKEVRQCVVNTRVRVYRNLNKPEYYSIKAMDGEHKGKVVGYAKSVVLKNVKFIVGEKSRLTVVKNQRRNVHAYCEGIIVDALDVVQTLSGYRHVVTYNPFKHATFFVRETKASFTAQCEKVVLQGADVYVY